MDFNGIALAGVPGAGKSALAKKLAQIFNWQIISVGDLWRQRLHKSGNDKLMGFEEYWRQVPKDDNLAMDLQIEKIFAQGSVIGECRFAKHLQKYPLLLVFVTADIDTRAKYKMDKYGGKTAGEIKEI